MTVGSKIQTGLPQFPEGVPKELFSQFFNIYTAIQNLARQLSTYAGVDQQDTSVWNQVTIDDTILVGGMQRWYVIQYEALTFGQVVSPILDAGTLKVRKANATNNTKPACGIVISSNHISAIGAYCEVGIGIGLVTGISGMVAGTRYFLSTTDGLVSNTAPVAAGNIEQVVGWAMASNRLFMNLNMAWIQH